MISDFLPLAFMWQLYIVFQSWVWGGPLRWYQIFWNVLIFFFSLQGFHPMSSLGLVYKVNILNMITNTHKNYELSLRRLIWFVLKILKVFSCFFLYLSLISRLGGGNRGAPLSPWWWRSKEKESYFDAACHKHVRPGSSQLKVLFEHLAFIMWGLDSLKSCQGM